MKTKNNYLLFSLFCVFLIIKSNKAFSQCPNDTTAPHAICNSITVQLDGNGQAFASAEDIGFESYDDDCRIASFSLDKSVFDCSNLGANTVVLTVTDLNGNSSTCTTTVIVEDHTAPTANCKPVNVQLDANGQAFISVDDIDNGSSDGCGIASITIDKDVFTCANVGNNLVTLTVVDVNGNSSSCAVSVRVEDRIAPIISCPASILVQAQENNSSSIVNWEDPVITENCTYTVVSNYHSGDNFPVGTTVVTYSVIDASGNTADCSFEVTVISAQSPLTATVSAKTYIGGNNISCKGKDDGEATVTVAGGRLPYSYLWSNAQTGATATGLVAGTYTVTITDAGGATISLVITITEPAQLVANAGSNRTVYLGYASMACAALNGSATGGTPSYTYAWSNGASSPSTSVCPTATTVYELTVTDLNGCIANSEVTVCPVDVRCAKGGNAMLKGQGSKVMVCHRSANGKTETLCVDASAIPAHLAHGDQLGDCGANTACYTSTNGQIAGNNPLTIVGSTNGMSVLAYPNPFTTATTISFNTAQDDKVTIKVFNIEGALVSDLFEGDVKAGDMKEIVFDGNALPAGMYFVKVATASGKLITNKLLLNNQ